MKKRLVLLCFLFVLLFSIGTPMGIAAASQPSLAATSAVLMDYTTGKILYQKNAFAHRAPASTTKIITAVVAMEHSELKQSITVGPHASKIGGSSIYLASGERHTLEDLLYGMLLSSGNDASVAVAEALAGSEAKFAEWMTMKAHSIGAKESNFKNSNGLPDQGHYSTAFDLALITRYAMHNPTFADIVKTKKKEIEWPGHDWNRVLINHNKLLWRYEYADGVKTGYTREAGNCLVSSATKDGHRLIAVVLNSKKTYDDSQGLFQYGFNYYDFLKLATPEEQIGAVNVVEGVKEQVPVLPNRSLNIVIPKHQVDQLQMNLELPLTIEAPVERLQQVGELEVKLGQKTIDRVPLVSGVAVPKKTFWWKLWDWVRRFVDFNE